MNTTTEQNKAHRTDIAWVKSTGRSFDAAGERYISEYVNPWTGRAIRKSWRMTGRDWHIFESDGTRREFGCATLTIAKYEASVPA